MKFTGKERDSETGLDYFGARYLSSSQGRFASADEPFVDQFVFEPQSWNPYVYVRNRPLSAIDPDGRQKLDCAGKNAELIGCQVLAQWNADHGVHSASARGTTAIVHQDGVVEERTGNLAYRNNNPGNMRPYGFTKSKGSIGVDNVTTSKGKTDKVGFAVFEYSEAGEAALRALLATAPVQKRTIAEEMQVFAPATDKNDPVAYAKALAKALGVDVAQAMSTLTPEQLDKFVEQVKKQEGFYDPKGKSRVVHKP